MIFSVSATFKTDIRTTLTIQNLLGLHDFYTLIEIANELGLEH